MHINTFDSFVHVAPPPQSEVAVHPRMQLPPPSKGAGLAPCVVAPFGISVGHASPDLVVLGAHHMSMTCVYLPVDMLMTKFMMRSPSSSSLQLIGGCANGPSIGLP